MLIASNRQASYKRRCSKNYGYWTEIDVYWWPGDCSQLEPKYLVENKIDKTWCCVCDWTKT